MFSKILIAVDGSVGSQAALELGTQLQKKCDAELLLLSVYRDHNMWKASVTFVDPDRTASTDNAMEQYAKEVAENAKQFAKTVGAENVRSFYKSGGPARTIVEFGEKYGADLIVVGNTGLSGSKSKLLGGVARKVTNLAKCPVLVV